MFGFFLLSYILNIDYWYCLLGLLTTVPANTNFGWLTKPQSFKYLCANAHITFNSSTPQCDWSAASFQKQLIQWGIQWGSDMLHVYINSYTNTIIWHKYVSGPWLTGNNSCPSASSALTYSIQSSILHHLLAIKTHWHLL